MAFKRRTINICPVIHNEFSETMEKISDATTNLDEKVVKAGELLGINRYILSKMILSSNTSIQLIKNLSETMENYTDVELPEQLNEYITQIRQQILENPINEDDLPSYFNIICSEPVIQPIYQVRHPEVFDYDFSDDYDSYDENEDYIDDSIIKLIMTEIKKENIKDDVCTICLLQLCEDSVIELNCKHKYHENCIKQWLNHKVECPLCKAKYRL